MDPESLYHEISKALSGLDFEKIWPGFTPLKFALYDDEKCFFDGRYVEKTDAFCANTSINYGGEQIAIWKVAGETEISVLTSKIVHEMFHGYQTLRGWDCWPEEIEALFRYEYDAENLSIRLRENELLLALLGRFDGDAFRELLALRKLRSEKFPYQFSYEAKTEEIEGTANYVEWQVLKQLDERKAAELTDRMRAVMTKPEQLFPIRISCYFTGALLISALSRAGMYCFETSERPILLPILKDVSPGSGDFPGKEACLKSVSEAIGTFNGETGAIIRSALERNEIVSEGPAELLFVNIYNARCLTGFLTSTYFLMYRDTVGEKMIPGDFVIRMRDEKTIETVYRWR